jgi:molybdate transport system substrate-binding protein
MMGGLMMMRFLARLLAVSSVMLLPQAALSADKLTVFAAASMKDALEEAGETYAAQSGVDVVFSFAASSVLAKQIEAGAPADIFISADREWMDWLKERNLIAPETEAMIAGNRLVVAAAPETKATNDPRGLLSTRFAMGDPTHVPAGKYAQAALQSLGLWEEVQPNAVFTENVRIALEFVRRGELDAAIVYGSDRDAAPELVTAYTFPENSHSPIVYPAAVTAKGQDGARAFVEFLAGEEGRRIFEARGFTAPAL